MEINEKELLDSLEEYIKHIESKSWGDLTSDQIELIRDPKIKSLYRKKVRECLKAIINPLYDSIEKRSRFKFSNPNNLLTCKNMLKDLFNYYEKKGYSRDEIYVIASEADRNKKY